MYYQALPSWAKAPSGDHERQGSGLVRLVKAAASISIYVGQVWGWVRLN